MPVIADYDVNAFGGQIATGYDFASGITPEFALRYLHIGGADYTNKTLTKIRQMADFLLGFICYKLAVPTGIEPVLPE